MEEDDILRHATLKFYMAHAEMRYAHPNNGYHADDAHTQCL